MNHELGHMISSVDLSPCLSWSVKLSHEVRHIVNNNVVEIYILCQAAERYLILIELEVAAP